MNEKKDSPYRFRYVPNTNKKEAALINEVERKMGGRLTEASLSEEQQVAFAAIRTWYDVLVPQGILTLGGFAGTGKSTLISVLAGEYSAHAIAFAAYTGKATSVLRKKFMEAGVDRGHHNISTLHSLMYLPIVDEEAGNVRAWKRREHLEYDLIVVDEASMMDKKLYEDLLLYGIPILAVGDHGQLPPVFGDFNLMEKPLLRLEQIHRQAEGSPILALSAFVRRTGAVPRQQDDAGEVQVLELSQLDDVLYGLFGHPGIRYDDIGVLAFTNRERVEFNEKARKARWGPSYAAKPLVGDQVICLKNTDATIFNGMRGIITHLDPKYETVYHYYGTILFEDDEIQVTGPICKVQFGLENTIRDFEEYAAVTDYRVRSWDSIGLLLDYGYALTVHKSQGSQFEHVVVVNDPPRMQSFDMKKRALYTAVTRCSKYLVVLQ